MRLAPRAWSRSAGARAAFAFGACALCGCQDEFPLGSWDSVAASGGSPSGVAGATGAAGAAGLLQRASPSCGDIGVPGPLNATGSLVGSGNVGTTNLYTDWSWPTPVDSLEWDLVIENDPSRDGYYWAHQFSFVNGLTGFLGIQAHGGYTDPMNADDPGVHFVKMALFWIGGSQLTAELGDVQEPNARALVVNTRGADWMTINAKYDWTACDLYHLRLAKDGTDASGNVWYGAWVEDRTTGVLTFLGRIAVPPDWGQISRLSTTLTTRIDNATPTVTTCDQPQPASAIFGTPIANDGQLEPTHTNRFIDPPRCPSSRFTELPEGIRQEIAVPAP